MKKILAMLMIPFLASPALCMEMDHNVTVSAPAIFDHPVVYLVVAGLLILAVASWVSMGLRFAELMITATKKSVLSLVLIGLMAGTASAQEPIGQDEAQVAVAEEPYTVATCLMLMVALAVPCFTVTHPKVEKWIIRQLLRVENYGPLKHPLMFCVGIIATPAMKEVLIPTGNWAGMIAVTMVLAVICFDYMRMHIFVMSRLQAEYALEHKAR